MICALCGHGLVNHGDRAITACDGEYGALGMTRSTRGGPFAGAECACPGWALSPELTLRP